MVFFSFFNEEISFSFWVDCSFKDAIVSLSFFIWLLVLANSLLIRFISSVWDDILSFNAESALSFSSICEVSWFILFSFSSFNWVNAAILLSLLSFDCDRRAISFCESSNFLVNDVNCLFKSSFDLFNEVILLSFSTIDLFNESISW